MATATYTPGPWIFYADVPSTDPNWHIVTTANRMRVLANVHIEPGNDVDMAIARLIAAAPELLAAVLAAKEFEQHAGGTHMPAGAWFRLHEQLSAAITKATGVAA